MKQQFSLRQAPQGQSQIELPTQKLAPGTYFVEIGLESGVVRRKFTKL